MSFLTLYIVSTCTMLFYYWLDRKNTKYRDFTYGELAWCAIMVFVPIVNTLAASFSTAYVIVASEFWRKQPFKKE